MIGVLTTITVIVVRDIRTDSRNNKNSANTTLLQQAYESAKMVSPDILTNPTIPAWPRTSKLKASSTQPNLPGRRHRHRRWHRPLPHHPGQRRRCHPHFHHPDQPPPPTSGAFSFYAKAFTSKGAFATSATKSVTIHANAPPTITLTRPNNGQSFVAPANIPLTAFAADSDGTVAYVQLLANGVLLQSITNGPYSYTWNNVDAGSYALTGIAYDNLGATTISSPVNVTVAVNSPPTVSLTSPANGQTFYSPATISLAADSEGTIDHVQLLANGIPVTTISTPPFTYAWVNPTPRAYTLTARAYDNLGAATTSDPIAITVAVNNPPTVSLTSPSSGQNFYTPATVSISATATDAGGSVVHVNVLTNGVLLATINSSTEAIPFRPKYRIHRLPLQPSQECLESSVDKNGLNGIIAIT